jgi:hypothetical protein
MFIYAQNPGGSVTLEIVDPEVSDEIPLAWSAATEREVWEKAFPPTEAEPLSFDESFMPREGTAAHAELAVSQDDEPGGLFD